MEQRPEQRHNMAYISPLLAPELNGGTKYVYSRERMRFECTLQTTPRKLPTDAQTPPQLSLASQEKDNIAYYHTARATPDHGSTLAALGDLSRPSSRFDHFFLQHDHRSNSNDAIDHPRHQSVPIALEQPAAPVLARTAHYQHMKGEASPHDTVGSTPDNLQAAIKNMEHEAEVAQQHKHPLLSPAMPDSEDIATRMRSSSLVPRFVASKSACALTSTSIPTPEERLDQRFRVAFRTNPTNRTAVSTEDQVATRSAEPQATAPYQSNLDWAEIARGTFKASQVNRIRVDTTDAPVESLELGNASGAFTNRELAALGIRKATAPRFLPPQARNSSSRPNPSSLNAKAAPFVPSNNTLTMASEQYQRDQRNLDHTPSTTLSTSAPGGDDRNTETTAEHRHLDQQKPAPLSYAAAAAATSRSTMTNASSKSQRETRIGASTPGNNYQPRTLESLSLQEKAQIGLVPQGTTRAGQQFEWDMGARNLASRTKIGVMDSPTQYEKQNYIFASPSTRPTEPTSSMATSSAIVRHEPPRRVVTISPAYHGETRVFNINGPGDMKEGSNVEGPPLGTIGQFRFQMPPKDPSTDFALPGSLGLPVPRNKKEMDDMIDIVRANRGPEEGGVSLKGYEETAFAAMQREALLQLNQHERVAPDVWRSSHAAVYQHAPTTAAEHEGTSQAGQDMQMATAGPLGGMAARSASDWRAPGGPSLDGGFAAFHSMDDRYKRLGR
ncbi:hypothetical protein EJ03DRAFT_356344 [Teratosphaeria nubilosa]|uniref:Uncharacterized protein n=1 Tax=Teratosphaeria nubilosa TaxID=161662 RepID=A0A6G1KT31_9PEZI|nr:hypothetical protein EJ03DRAFT_356344 [Teratosphaeria nubilosa]